MSGDRAAVLGCELDRVEIDEAVLRCERYIEAREPAQYMAVNAAKVVAVQRDQALGRMINRCEIVTADGQSVVWASRLLGDPVPSRVTGIDLMYRLLTLAELRGYGVYVLGARPDVLERALAVLRRRLPGLRIAGYRDGYFSTAEEPAIVSAIRAARPEILFVGLPSPRKEYFLARWRPELDVPLCLGVGGAIDILAGVRRRAPGPVQQLGLEWAFRLVQEPRRLLRRYAVTNSRFLALTVRQVLHGARQMRGRAG
jgi:N-acetylglucosaminyldiphosphoundecaprenol N-acetyl-beta-D-mannosaminyltransferase